MPHCTNLAVFLSLSNLCWIVEKVLFYKGYNLGFLSYHTFQRKGRPGGQKLFEQCSKNLPKLHSRASLTQFLNLNLNTLSSLFEPPSWPTNSTCLFFPFRINVLTVMFSSDVNLVIPSSLVTKTLFLFLQIDFGIKDHTTIYHLAYLIFVTDTTDMSV